VLERLEAIESQTSTASPDGASTIWIVELQRRRRDCRPFLLPGIRELTGFALSHLTSMLPRGWRFCCSRIQASRCRRRNARVNLYGEDPEDVPAALLRYDHRTVRCRAVIRYSRRGVITSIQDVSPLLPPGRTSLGHSWLPNQHSTGLVGERVFCSFNGFRPRCYTPCCPGIPRGLVADLNQIRYVPPLLMRFDAARAGAGCRLEATPSELCGVSAFTLFG